MILRRKKVENNKKEETLDELKSKDSIYKEGIAGGVTGTVVGGLTAGLGYFGGKARENAKNKSLGILERHPALLKGAGIGVGTVGAGLATTSAIKHHKLKKKIKEKEKDEGSEKK